MARLPRLSIPNIPQHILQRGKTQQVCFRTETDFDAYCHWLEKYALKYNVALHAWVLMANHVHLLVTPSTQDGVSKMMQSLGRQYVRYFNYKYQRVGTLWEGRFRSCVVESESYFLLCQKYIELNSVRASLVIHPQDYKWSSYAYHGINSATLSDNSNERPSIWSPHDTYLALGETQPLRVEAYQSLMSCEMEQETLSQIRLSLNKSMALGSVTFKQQIEELSGRRVTPLKRGPKVKTKEA